MPQKLPPAVHELSKALRHMASALKLYLPVQLLTPSHGHAPSPLDTTTMARAMQLAVLEMASAAFNALLFAVGAGWSAAFLLQQVVYALYARKWVAPSDAPRVFQAAGKRDWGALPIDYDVDNAAEDHDHQGDATTELSTELGSSENSMLLD